MTKIYSSKLLLIFLGARVRSCADLVLKRLGLFPCRWRIFTRVPTWMAALPKICPAIQATFCQFICKITASFRSFYYIKKSFSWVLKFFVPFHNPALERSFVLVSILAARKFLKQISSCTHWTWCTPRFFLSLFFAPCSCKNRFN